MRREFGEAHKSIVDISTIAVSYYAMQNSSDHSNPGPRYSALLAVLKTSEVLWNSSRIFFAQWDLSPSQFNVLNLLRQNPKGLSQTELSQTLITHRSNVTGLVDRLEKRELVSRHETPGDRRAYKVQITRKGHILTSEILPSYYSIAEQVCGDITKDQLDDLRKVLSSLERNADVITKQLEEQ